LEKRTVCFHDIQLAEERGEEILMLVVIMGDRQDKPVTREEQ